MAVKKGTSARKSPADKIKPRLEALTALRTGGAESPLAHVMRTATDLRLSGKVPDVVRVRRRYYRHDEPVPVERERSGLPTDLQPRAAQLILPRGIAMKQHLMALYAAHCQAAPGHRWHNTIPIAPDEDSEFSWMDLMGVYARHDPQGRRSSRTENKQRQITEALKKLKTLDLVTFPHEGTTRPFRDFLLLSEGRRGGAGASISYKVPEPDYPGAIDIPVEFFTKGWVHLLTSSEIASYLMWLDLTAHGTEVVPYIPGLDRAGYYGTTRDTYETHRPLQAFGLLSVDFAEDRHADGKVAAGGEALCHRVTVVPGALDRPAGPAIRKALRAYGQMGQWLAPG